MSSTPAQTILAALPWYQRGLFNLALVGLIAIQFALWQPLIAVVMSLPLLLIGGFIMAGSLRAHAVAGFCGLFYLIHGLTETVANPANRNWAIAETVLAILLYLGLLAMARTIRRWKQR